MLPAPPPPPLSVIPETQSGIASIEQALILARKSCSIVLSMAERIIQFIGTSHIRRHRAGSLEADALRLVASVHRGGCSAVAGFLNQTRLQVEGGTLRMGGARPRGAPRGVRPVGIPIRADAHQSRALAWGAAVGARASAWIGGCFVDPLFRFSPRAPLWSCLPMGSGCSLS